MPRIALVTGGARGIGRAIAADLARDHRVAITYRTAPPEGLPPEILALPADFTDPAAAGATISALLERLGPPDVIVNNAGAIATTPKEGFDIAAHHAILDVNLSAPAALLAAALPHLKPGSAIVSISSVNARLPPRDAAIYGASKAALDLWTRAMAKELNTDLAIIDKRRPKANEAQVMNIIGEVEGRTCLLVDDIVDTAGTLCKAADALKAQGATTVIAYCTHPVLSGKAIENIKNSELDTLVVTNSIPLSDAARSCGRIRSLSLGRMLAEAVRRVSNEESIRAMFI